MMVGPNGRAVGVEHIPELVSFSINNIEKSAAAPQLKDGSLSVHEGGMISFYYFHRYVRFKFLYFLHNNSAVSFYLFDRDKHSSTWDTSLKSYVLNEKNQIV